MATDVLFKVKLAQGSSLTIKYIRFDIIHDGEIFIEQGHNFVYLPDYNNSSIYKKIKNSGTYYEVQGYPNNKFVILFTIYSNSPFTIKRMESSDGTNWTQKLSNTYNTQYEGGLYSSGGYNTYTSSMINPGYYNYKYETSNGGANQCEVLDYGILPYWYGNQWVSSLYTNYILSDTGWSSITSVSGKGKTYTLSKINSNYINNGKVVSNASASNFDALTTDSLLANLIGNVVQDIVDKTKILVNYNIPFANYNYIKLVYKKDAIPDNADDGTAITITQNSTSQEITGINQNGVYWFVIFTDKSTSDPKSFEVTGF